MTKILVWNIQYFSAKTVATGPSAPIKLAHILDTLSKNPPDIFSILELRLGAAGLGEGTLIQKGGSGETGCLCLLNAINAHPILGGMALGGGVVKKWRIVPPLVSGTGGKSEAVAVLYNSSKVAFKGPAVWKGPYPAPWNKKSYTLKTTYAGQFEYYNKAVPPAAPVKIFFPMVGNRAPFLTRFEELAGLKRTIDLYSVHTSPVTAVKGTAQIAKIPAFNFGAAPLAAKRVVVVAGDFNVSQANPAHVAKSYAKLKALGFAQAFDSAALPLPGAGVAQDAYAITSLRPIKTSRVTDPEWKAALGKVKFRVGATPFGSYPSYGYMLPPPSTLDNIFTKYPLPTPAGYPAAPKSQMIVNRVVGAPYALPAAAKKIAVYPLPKALVYGEYMGKNIPAFHALKAGGGNAGALTASFRGNAHYGAIRRTSDHMAVYVDV